MRSKYSVEMLVPTSSRYTDSHHSIFDLASPRRINRMLLFLCLLVSLQSSQAQNVKRNNEAVDLGLRSNLTVNPASRAVELQIPLGDFPGRAGHDVPVTISYSSKVWNMVYQGFNPGPPPGYPGPQPFTILMAKYGEHSVSGWNSTTGGISIDSRPGDQLYDQVGNPRPGGDCSAGCFVIDRVMAWMPDGSAHELRSSDQAIPFNQARPDNLYSVDGSRMRYQRSTNTVFLPNGSRYVLSNPGSYIDRNGNTINATDTLGRTIPNPPLASIPGDYNYSLPGVGVGGTVNYTFKWRYLADVLTTPQPLAYVADSGCPPGQGSFSPTLFTSDINSRTCIQNAMQLFNPVVLSQLVLPTGQAYTFTYTKYGEIDKVTLPTGGYEKYVYGNVAPLSSSPYVYAQYNRGVSSRTVSSTGLSADEVSWVYSSGSAGYVKIVAPDGTWTERYAWTDGNNWWGFSSDGARAGRAYDERVYSATNQMLRRKLTDWGMTGSNGGGFNGLNYANRLARVTRETEFILDTGGNALARTTTYGYDLTYQFDVGIDQTSVSEYDYVVVDQNTAQTIPVTSLSSIPTGTLLRTTQTAYLTGNANYRNRNIVGLPTSTTVYKGSPTDNIVVAQSSISYDEGGQFAQLNDYGNVVNWTDPQTPYRGNPTTTSQWLNFNGSTLSTFPSGTYLTTHAQYDQCGSVRKTWDARDTGLTNPSQVSYADAFSDYPRNTFAYPTSMTTAVPDASGFYGSNVAFTSTSIYDFNTGTVVSTTDANGKTTSYDYTDVLSRLRQVTSPDNGRVRYNYFDTPGDLYVQVLTDEDSSRSIETRKYFDGLSRPTRGFLYDGTASAPWLVKDTYYDTMGRVSKVSNPYRVSSPSSTVPASCSACTTRAYDALGRVISVTTPDTAQVTTSYAALTSGSILGTTVLVTDQAGKKRRSLTDSFGRLVRVDEPDATNGNLGDVSSPVQPTSYAYDVLGNLRIVTQGSQQRFFMYDSLSRLVRARNPEQIVNANLTPSDNSQWCMGYAYDANGNLTTKIDARNVTATYAYDALNRNKTITYTNDPTATPTVSRFYDGWRGGSYDSSITNSKGRLWQTETAGGNGMRTTIAGYDVMGRPLQQKQHFNTASGWSASYTMSRSYDLAGHVLSQTYPSGHLMTYNYDTAGRLGDKVPGSQNQQDLAFSGNLGDGVARIYSSGITYSEFGGLQQEQFGTQTPLYHKLHYSIRGQMYDVRLSTVPWATDHWNWNRGALVLYFGYAHQQSGPLNNGNVSMMQHFVPANYPTSYNYTEQRYVYDKLNRLTSVAEYPATQGGLGAVSFTQIFDYDRWGNRTINPATTNAPEPQFTASSATNRLGVAAGYTGRMDYDVAGNLVNDTYTSYGRTDGTPTRLYDAENRLTTAKDSNLQVVSSYSYNADGQRTRRKLGAVETRQVYGMDGELLAEYAAGAATFVATKEYGYRNGELLVTVTSGDDQRLKRFVQALYYGAVQRDPTSQELTDKSNELALAGAQSQAQLLVKAKEIARALFVQTTYETNPARSDTQYVTDLYYAYLQRGPDTGGLNWWVGQAAGSLQNRINVLNAFEASSEFQALASTLYGTATSDNQRTENFVTNMYQGAFSAPPNSTELATNSATLNNAAAVGQPEVISAAETMGRSLFAGQVNDANLSNTQYVTNVYEAFLQRGPDAGGLAFWSGGATVGAGRQNVLNAFATCPPFRELAGTLYREAYWLVADQLGTPRMVVNKSGSLAGVKRHDYLPFGEELGLISGRTPLMGYTSNDTVRQKFTSKERDNETGLDYFGARYYASTQGRFTSPDIPFMDQWESNPQSWNLYSYVRNNPLRLVDPTGNAAEVPCDKICQESKQRAEEERKKAEAEGIDTITIPMVDSGVPRDGGGPNLTIAEALQEQEDRRRSFIVNNVAAGIGYGIGRAFSGIAGLFRGGFKAIPGTTPGLPASAPKPLGWGSWGSYAKVIEGGKEYAEIGGRLYPYHIVERMMPRGLTTLGRSVSPTFVEEVIRTGTQSQRVVDGVLRTAHTSGSVSVITEDGGRIVVTVITR